MSNKEKLGQEPAFARSASQYTQYATHSKQQQGMSKRFYAACAAMQGLLSNSFYAKEMAEVGDLDKRKLILQSYKIADELLEQESQ